LADDDPMDPFEVLKMRLVTNKISSKDYKKMKKSIEKNELPVRDTSPNFVHHQALRLSFARGFVNEKEFKEKNKILLKEDKETKKRLENKQKQLRKEFEEEKLREL